MLDVEAAKSDDIGRINYARKAVSWVLIFSIYMEA